MIHYILNLYILILLFCHATVQALEVVYYRDFTPGVTCTSLFSAAQYWSMVSSSYSSSKLCQYSCSRSDNGNTAYILAPDMSDYPNGLQMTKALTQPYSFIGVDLVYLRKIDSLTMSVYDGSTKIFQQDYSGASVGTTIEYNYSLECSSWSGNMQVTKEIAQINNRLTSSNIIVRFKQTVSSSWAWYGVLKLRVWANCAENCDSCADNTNCNKCLPGFKRYSLPSGQKVCEQTHNCSISNCYSCIKSSPSSSSAICVRCMPGYTLNASSACIANSGSCTAGKYQSGSGCVSYSQNCYMQQQNTSITWVTCSSAVNKASYYCVNTEEILIYEHRNFQLSTCGCRIQYCIECPTNGSCQKCLDGYTYNSVTHLCEFQNCPLLYTKDPNTGECLKNCSGNNCEECDTTQCKVCNQTGNYYIVTASPQDCQLCTIPNCSQCSGEGLCQKCANMYSLSGDRSTCLPCNVSECDLCEAGFSDQCQTCSLGYILSADKKSCQCAVANCSVCNSENGAICDNCVTGYLISADQSTCSCDAKHCAVCNPTDGSKCITCVTGYNQNLTTTKCYCAVSNCNVCNELNGAFCDSCNQDYAPVNTQTSTCSCQVFGCAVCLPSNGKVCQTCEPGYSQSGSTLDCQCGVKNCQICNQTDGSKCDTCLYNFLQSNDHTLCTCQINNCTECHPGNGKICITPFPGYKFEQANERCVCTFPNCKTCDNNDGTICLQCQDGYVKDSNQNCVCAVENCQSCYANDGNKCQQCIPEYTTYTDQQKILCKVSCTIPNCSVCEDPPFNKTKCKTCESNYELNPTTNQCELTKCEVRMCKTCKKYDPQVCLECFDDSYLLNSQFQCFLKERNDFDVQQEVIDNVGYNVSIKFQKKIVIIENKLSDLLTVSIVNYDKKFETNFISSQNNTINLQLVLKENCKDKTLNVKMHDPNFVQINNLNSNQKEVQLEEYVKKSEEQKQQAEVTKKVAQGAASTLTYTVILVVILGNSYILFSTIDLTTFIYFLLFINVRYPDNMLAFCEIFKNFQFAFIPNIFQAFITDKGYMQPYTPQKFIDNGADAYFLNGAGQSFTIIIGIMTIYGGLKLLTLIPIPSIKVYVVSKIQSGWEYCGFLDLIGCVYMYVLVSALLQFYCFEFTESLSFISYTLFSFCFIAVFFIPIMMAIFISNCKDLTDPKIQQQYASLIGGFKIKPNPLQAINQSPSPTNSKISPQESSQELEVVQQPLLNKQQRLMYKWSRYTNVILYLRKLIYAMIVIFLYNHVYLQMVLISLLNIFLAWFYLYIKPQEGKYDNIRNGISEIFLIIIQITVCLLVTDDEDQDEQERYNIGWVIIACASTILAMHIFNVILDLLKATFNLFKDFICTLIKPKKELEKIKKEKLGELENSENKLFGVTSQISLEKIRSVNKKLSTIIVQQSPDSPLKKSQAFRKLQIRALLIKSVASLATKSSKIDTSQQKINNLDSSKIKVLENDNEKGGVSICSSPTSKQFANSNRNIEQSALLYPNNSNNQTLNQIYTARQINSGAQSLNVSNNDLASNKIPSQSQLL